MDKISLLVVPDKYLLSILIVVMDLADFEQDRLVVGSNLIQLIILIVMAWVALQYWLVKMDLMLVE